MNSRTLFFRYLTLSLVVLLLPLNAKAEDDAGSNVSIKESINEPEKDAVKDSVSKLLAEKKFADLERDLNVALELYKKGQMKAEDLQKKFNPFRAQTHLGLEPLHTQWVDAFPDSYAARLARGMFFHAIGWTQRGNKFVRDTTSNQIDDFQKYIKLAEIDLVASLKLSEKPVLSLAELIRTSGETNKRDMRDWLDAAFRADPLATSPGYNYLFLITPKWGGDFKSMDELVEEIKASAWPDIEKRQFEARALIYKGEYARGEEKYAEAIYHYKKSYALYPKNNASIHGAISAAISGKIYDGALELLNEAIMADPKDRWALNKRGYLFETQIKDNGKALKDYMASVRYGSGWAENRLGWWYYTGTEVTKDEEKAELYFRRAAAQGNVDAKSNLKNLLAAKKK
jgi:tetratricopeptide (TPR) repeat protein